MRVIRGAISDCCAVLLWGLSEGRRAGQWGHKCAPTSEKSAPKCAPTLRRVPMALAGRYRTTLPRSTERK